MLAFVMFIEVGDVVSGGRKRLDVGLADCGSADRIRFFESGLQNLPIDVLSQGGKSKGHCKNTN